MAEPAPEVEESVPGVIVVTRRSLLKKGLLGAALLTIGGTAAVALKKTRATVPLPVGLKVFSPAEYQVFAAIARRVVAAGPGHPSPDDVEVALKADRVLALGHPSVQKEFKQLLMLFENGLTGALTGTGLATFTSSRGKAQDARLNAWARSRIPLFRTGFQAMKRLSAACYYASAPAWAATGYPGPPEIAFPPELAAS
jgi:hypothetical protein